MNPVIIFKLSPDAAQDSKVGYFLEQDRNVIRQLKWRAQI